MNETRVCKHCGNAYPATIQYFNKVDGRLRHVCKPCHNRYLAEWRHRRKLIGMAYFSSRSQPHYVMRADQKQAYLFRIASGWLAVVGDRRLGMATTWDAALALARGEVS